MKFYVNSTEMLNHIEYPFCNLIRNSWNDWGFLTTFSLKYYPAKGVEPFIFGSVKIGKTNMNKPETYSNTLKTPLPDSFNILDEDYFSLGNSSDYYSNFYKFGLENKDEQENILRSLRDVVFDISIYKTNNAESVMMNSLMRNSSVKTVKDVYAQVLSTGNEHLTPYNFSIKLKKEITNTKMNFNVSPETLPQSNIHTLIGRNGVGKTNIFTSIISTLSGFDSDSNVIAEFIGKENISSVLALSYSIFDTTLPKKNIFGEIPYRFIGFIQENNPISNQSLNDFINSEFINSVDYMREHEFLHTLVSECIDTLNSDPVFESLNVKTWLAENNAPKLKTLYSKLSSGHKIVLLSIFKIIISVEPNSIVLIDEPEQNLHPPLISSFIQAILNVLKKRNAMAIIATHSPVIVQECTTESTWILNRSNDQLKINRPTIKTFGANVGEITYDVFDLEVDKSGYMDVINKAVATHNDIASVVDIFHNKIGTESYLRIASILYQKRVND
ncbi:AAA family ATPase [uncultured Weissella sp.]|uniref:AAA family ATPase n=1 Tax=uncultured Weissella sp. TaxID=253243 RepID=UPI002586AC54|nr:AAA family ATPase [uncultured Weissella sp.]